MKSCSPLIGASYLAAPRTDGYQIQKMRAADHRMPRTPKETYRVTEIMKETISSSHASFPRQHVKFENQKVDQRKHFPNQHIESKPCVQQESEIFFKIEAAENSSNGITSEEKPKESMVAIRQVGESQKPKLAQWTKIFPLKYLNRSKSMT
jgi:hypothetical protein